MEILLIRHTTPNIDKGICYGQADIDVVETFDDEVQVIQEQLPKSINEYKVFSSPLVRCKKLAEQLFSDITFDDRLKELNFGDWELKEWNDINKIELDKWMNDFVNLPAKNGESYIDLHERTTNFISELQQKQYKKVILVTHAGVIRSINAFINDIPLEKSFELKLNYGQLLTLSL